jgi:hypothetical protein
MKNGDEHELILTIRSLDLQTAKSCFRFTEENDAT